MPRTNQLTPREIKFVREFVRNGGNATAAHRIAYPRGNPRLANRNARHVIRRERVLLAIQSRRLTEDLDRTDLIAMHHRSYEEAMARSDTSGACEILRQMAILLGFLTRGKRS